MPATNRRALGAGSLCIAAALLIAGGASAGETLDRVRAKGVVVDVVVNDYPPFGFINDKNELDGFDVEVARAFAKKLGVELKIETPAGRRSSAATGRAAGTSRFPRRRRPRSARRSSTSPRSTTAFPPSSS